MGVLDVLPGHGGGCGGGEMAQGGGDVEKEKSGAAVVCEDHCTEAAEGRLEVGVG